jgi:hypothetical protein
MKPNGKYFAVRSGLLTVCVLGLLSSFGGAETMHGSFKLKSATHWGMLLLAPGAYEFSIEGDPSGSMVTVRSKDTSWSGMAMAKSRSDAHSHDGTKLVLEDSEESVYVRALCLGDEGIALNYAAPKFRKGTDVTRIQPPGTVASAAGVQ